MATLIKHLVLIGGGHSHAIALKLFGTKPLPGVRLTAIADTSQTPYSGMLPGHIAGFYDFNECHIDLSHLAQFARCQLLIDRAVGLDLENNKVLCANMPPVGFDLLSIDIGSTPATISVPGAAEWAIPAKPVPQLLASWNQIVEMRSREPLRIGIVGGGAGGVELALAMDARLDKILNHIREIHLFQSAAEIMPTHNLRVRQILQEILLRRGIKLHLGETVCEVQPQFAGEALPSTVFVRCESGLTVECDRLFWVTRASAQSWLRSAGLATDEAGFIQVSDTLQSISHPHIFATGDIATTIDRPRPKAGVFAVRQGKPLFENLQRALQGKPLKPFIPQKQFLTLIGTGMGEAIATRGAWAWGPNLLLWHWKDWIDRRFMEQFKNLPQSETGL